MTKQRVNHTMMSCFVADGKKSRCNDFRKEIVGKGSDVG